MAVSLARSLGSFDVCRTFVTRENTRGYFVVGSLAGVASAVKEGVVHRTFREGFASCEEDGKTRA
jgi:hypothetical protein